MATVRLHAYPAIKVANTLRVLDPLAAVPESRRGSAWACSAAEAIQLLEGFGERVMSHGGGIPLEGETQATGLALIVAWPPNTRMPKGWDEAFAAGAFRRFMPFRAAPGR